MDLAYIKDSGRAVRRCLARGETCEIAYAPGNSTQYLLVFLPVGLDNGALVTASDWMDHGKLRSIFRRGDHSYVETENGWTLVSWIGHASWLFQIGPDANPARVAPYHASYIAEKMSCSIGDADALAALFSVVSLGHPPLSVL